MEYFSPSSSLYPDPSPEKNQNTTVDVDPGEIDMLISQKEDELNQINQLRIATLEKMISDKSKVIDQLQERLQEFALLVDIGNRTERAKEEQEEQLKEMVAVKEKLVQAKRKLKDKDMEISELRTQLDATYHQLVQEKSKANFAEESVAEIEKRVGNDLNEIKSQYEEELRSITQEHLQEQEKFRIALKEKESEIESLKHSLQAASNQVLSETQKRTQEETEMAELRDELERKIRDCEEIAEQAQEIDLERNRLVQELKRSEQEQQITREAISNFEKLVTNKNASILQLEDNLKNLKVELASVKSKAERDQKELKSTLSELQEKYQAKQQDLEREITSIVQDKEAEREQLSKDWEGKVRRLEQSLALAKNELRNKETLWNEELERKKVALQRSEAEVLHLEQRLEFERKRMEEEKRDWEKQIAIASAKREGVSEEIKFYKQKLDAKAKELEKISRKLDEYEKRERIMRSELEELKDSVQRNEAKERSENMIKDLRENVQGLENELTLERRNTEKLRTEVEKLRDDNEALRRRQGMIQSLKSIDLQNLKKSEPVKDSLEELREDFNKNMQLIDESVIKQKENDRGTIYSKIGSPARPIKTSANYQPEDTENLKLEFENLEIKLKVSEAEKKLLGDDLIKLKDELLHQREQNLRKDRECFEKTTRINELEKEIDKVRLERDRLAKICTDLKTELSTLQNKLIRQGGTMEDTGLVGYRNRILELENYVRELSNQLEKWAGGKPKAGLKSPQKEEQKLQIEGINVEQPGRPFTAFAPPVHNTERQTMSQQRAGLKIKKEVAKKPKAKVRNYNIKDDTT